MSDNELKLKLSIKIFKTEKVFGPGVATLLEHIKIEGSIYKASKSMNIAYSKAWKIIKNFEKEVGIKLIETKRGGIDGGGSSLSREGENFLKKYRIFEQKLNIIAENLFDEIF